MRDPSDVLTNGDDEEVLAALFRMGASEEPIPHIDEETVSSLLLHVTPEVRERTLFVFGIKGRRKDLCAHFEGVLARENEENWVILGAAIGALYSSRCFDVSASTKSRMLRLLDSDRLRDRIGNLISAFALRASESIDDDEYIKLTLISGEPALELLARARRAIS